MLKLIKYLIMFFLLATSQLTIACDCGSAGEFLTVAPNTDFVALVKVMRYLTFKPIDGKKIPMSMEVEIIINYMGIEKRSRVVVWGDNGILCRPYLNQFDIGNYYVISFFNGLNGTKGHVHKEEKTTDYFISSCGDYWLKADIRKRIAIGNVTPIQNKIKLSEIRANL